MLPLRQSATQCDCRREVRRRRQSIAAAAARLPPSHRPRSLRRTARRLVWRGGVTATGVGQHASDGVAAVRISPPDATGARSAAFGATWWAARRDRAGMRLTAAGMRHKNGVAGAV